MTNIRNYIKDFYEGFDSKFFLNQLIRQEWS